MSRFFAALAAAVMVLAVSVGSVAAADPVSITIHDATLLAKGAAVEVTFDIVCDGYDTGVDYGYASVTQRVGRGLIASGSGEEWTWGTWSNPLVCDGTTVNSFSQVVGPETGVAFKSGTALVEVYVSLFGPHRLTLEMRLHR